MADTDPLSHPILNDEVGSLQDHAHFLIRQMEMMREKIDLAKSLAPSTSAEAADVQMAQTMQAQLVDILRDLDDTTKKLNVLIGLPSVEVDTIDVNKMDVNTLSTNPDLSPKYNILTKVPTVVLLGGGRIDIASPLNAGKGNDDRTPELLSARQSCSMQGTPSTEGLKQHLLSAMEKQVPPTAEQIQRELEIQEKEGVLLRKQVKAKEAQLKRMKADNEKMLAALKELLPAQSDVVANALSGGHPRNEKEVNVLIKYIKKENEKLNNQIKKKEYEIQQQGRTNALVSRQGIVPTIETDQRGVHIDISKEQVLNKVSLALNKVRKAYDRTKSQVEELKTSLNPLIVEKEEMERAMVKEIKKQNHLCEIIDEKLVAEELPVELEEMNQELLKFENQMKSLNQEERRLREVFELQDRELTTYRQVFLRTQKKYEKQKCHILQRDQRDSCKVTTLQDKLDYYRSEFKNEMLKLRKLPNCLAAAQTHSLKVENALNALKQDILILRQEISSQSKLVQELMRVKEEKTAQAASCEVVPQKLATLREMYERKQLRMNQMRQMIQELEIKKQEIEKQENMVTLQIEERKQTVSELEAEYKTKMNTVRNDCETRKKDQMDKLVKLEMKLVEKRANCAKI